MELYTSRFAYGRVAQPQGYGRQEFFYRAAARVPAARALDARSSSPSTCPTCCATGAPRARRTSCTSSGSPSSTSTAACSHAVACPLVLTAHDVLPREPRSGQRAAQRRLYERFDAIVVHSRARRRAADARARRRARPRARDSPRRLRAPRRRAPPPRRPPFATDKPVVLCFGLMRPYKGIDLLLEAWRGIEDAELWIAGMPRMDISRAPRQRSRGRPLRPALHRRRRAARVFSQRPTSSCCPTARSTSRGCCSRRWPSASRCCSATSAASRRSPPQAPRAPFLRATPAALQRALLGLLGDRGALAEMAVGSQRRGRGEYSWQAIARQTLATLRAACAAHSAGRPPESLHVLVLAILFWLCAALIVWTQLGYALALALLVRSRSLRAADSQGGPRSDLERSCRRCR